MKPQALSANEKALLRCRGVIETVIGQLKVFYGIENTMVRSTGGFIINILGALIAYQIKPFKPSINPCIKYQFSIQLICG